MKNRKNKLTNFLKFGILLFGISLFLSSCENDEIIPQPIQNNHQKFELQKFQKTDSEDFLIKEFENLGVSKKQMKSEKIVQSKNYNFSIFTEDVMVNEANNSKTYTFQVQSFQENYLKNLVVNQNTITNEVSKFLVTYYKNGNDYDFTKTNVLKLSDNYSKNSQRTSDPDCYETSVWEEVTVDYACGSGDHIGNSEFNDCNLEGFDKPFSISNGYWVSVELCFIQDVSCRGCGDETSNTGSTGSSSGVNTTPLNSLSYAFFQFFKGVDEDERLWLDNNTIERNEIQKILEKNDTPETLEFAKKTLNILRGVSDITTLTTEYEHKSFIEVSGNTLQKKNSTLFTQVNLFTTTVKQLPNLSLTEWAVVSLKLYEIYKIIPAATISSFTDFNQFALDQQKLIAKNSFFLALLPNVKSILGEYWPKNDEEWSVINELIKQALPELIIGFIPGSSVLDVVSGIDKSDATTVAIGIAGLAADAFGGSILKGLAKAGRIAYKVFKSFKVIHKFLKAVSKAIQTGLKTKLIDDVVHLTDNANTTVAKIKNNVVEVITTKGLKLVDPDNLKKLTKIDPTASGFINKTKLTNAKKFKPSEAGLKADFDNLKNLDNNQLGLQSETLANKLFKQDDYLAYDAKIPGFNRNNGFDGVYIKKDAGGNVTDIIINEVKQVNSGAIALSPANTATGLPRQMTNAWVENVIVRMELPNTSQSVKNLAALIKANDDKITKVVTGIDKTKGEVLVFTIN